ncbi:flagellar hook-length control protein FliK [Oceanidesulfovibrio marinus]|uniref:Flagellar hook-length control protein FliK n=1 Tax=Oceanidesulfovibrio marinus TaxID=370038 RepID=A0ABX6NGW7_9BACT|nr:flagellar hook-length control protein FliK [Oceanidesulfovibrio marinus]QJT08845.1 flagellar hook-length control protein FliK [Oceanidesulfovibrio marinus]
MQIFPEYAERAEQAMNALGKSASQSYSNGYASSSQPFADLLDTLASADSAARSTAQSTADTLYDTGRRATESYASQTASSPDDSLEDSAAGLLVSQEDFADLRGDLEKYGLDSDDIDALEEQVNSPEGMTWRELMNKVSTLAAQHVEGGQSLDVETKRLLTGFLGRIGCNITETKDIIADLDESKLDAAWQKIASKLATLSPTDQITVSRDEVKALARAFNVPGTNDASLSAFFAGGGKLTMNAAGLQNLVFMLKQASGTQSSEALENAAESLKSIHEKLQDAISNAMDRAKREELADNKETKSVSQAKVRIKKAAEENYGEAAGRVSRPNGTEAEQSDTDHFFKKPVMENSADAGKTADAKDAAAKDAKDGDLKAAAVNNTKDGADELAETKKAADAATDRFAKNRAENAAVAQDKAAGQGKDNAGGGGSDGSSDRGENGWSAFWNKVSKGEATADTTKNFYSVADTAAQAEARATSATQRADQALGRQGSLPRQTLRSLEQAFMKNLGQGQRQLTLRLDPPQMGRVQVMLTVRNNEVSAVLRTEKHETGQMLAEQMQHLRHSLEQQGLKVQKLDVQTQLNNDMNSQGWLGMDQHNSAQEQNARQQAIHAWKQMGGRGSDAASLAHDVQNGNVQELISQGGLHLIA